MCQHTGAGAVVVGLHLDRARPAAVGQLLQDDQGILVTATSPTGQHGSPCGHSLEISQPEEMHAHEYGSRRGWNAARVRCSLVTVAGQRRLGAGVLNAE
jgi:hypothetical protein